MPTQRSCVTQMHAIPLRTVEWPICKWSCPLPTLYSQGPFPQPMPSQLNTVSAVRLLQLQCTSAHRHKPCQSEEVSDLSTSESDPSLDSISKDPSCSSLCSSSSLILLLGSRPEPSAPPPCKQKHKQTEQRWTIVKWTETSWWTKDQANLQKANSQLG